MRNKGLNPAGFPLYREVCRLGVPTWHDIPPYVKKDGLSPADAILHDIYRINPLTGLPEGDLAVFMNENTSPDVRDYIQRNLLRENANVITDSSGLPDLDDDTILELTRGKDESSVSYTSRVFEYLKGVRQSELEKQRNKEERASVRS